MSHNVFMSIEVSLELTGVKALTIEINNTVQKYKKKKKVLSLNEQVNYFSVQIRTT